MLFIIAGLSPKVKDLDENRRTCPVCGERAARMRRVDHWFHLFFFPLFPVRKGEPFLFCEGCEGKGSGPVDRIPPPPGRRRCPSCGEATDPGFRYCPFCGQRL
jgi:RNA polymerase subunit RPABC4/transcription elongation factor Spt4